MGLDINIGVNNDEIVFSDEYHNDENGYFERHSLSREFCNFMSRQHVFLSRLRKSQETFIRFTVFIRAKVQY
ncbi:hypothetical protein DMB65_08315 [Flavobacterium cheongpyeongense]|uniref:Uncharacterized protein n=1 Tax=Flavobacterium cheongpyeongense TaxID=2212651 RepID=A0A2V4BQX9_9FLAO|nr:hypothetical protein DMB65_08315 [Flavobacterium cheongpyeongense]